jgi:hypothetical protein
MILFDDYEELVQWLTQELLIDEEDVHTFDAVLYIAKEHCRKRSLKRFMLEVEERFEKNTDRAAVVTMVQTLLTHCRVSIDDESKKLIRQKINEWLPQNECIYIEM